MVDLGQFLPPPQEIQHSNKTRVLSRTQLYQGGVITIKMNNDKSGVISTDEGAVGGGETNGVGRKKSSIGGEISGLTLKIKGDREPPLVGCVNIMITAYIVATDAPPRPPSPPCAHG